MKSAGIILMCSGVILTGILAVSRRIKRAALLKGVAVFFTELSSFAKMRGGDMLSAVDSAERAAVKCPEFIRDIINGYSFGDDLCSLWRQNAALWSSVSVLSDAESDLLISYGSVFLSESADDFCRRTTDFAERFLQISVVRQEENNRTGRLTISFCVLGAAALMIILI